MNILIFIALGLVLVGIYHSVRTPRVKVVTVYCEVTQEAMNEWAATQRRPPPINWVLNQPYGLVEMEPGEHHSKPIPLSAFPEADRKVLEDLEAP